MDVGICDLDIQDEIVLNEETVIDKLIKGAFFKKLGYKI